MISSFEVAIIALISALAIDSFNLWLIVRLWRWSQHAGKSILSEMVKNANLKIGNSGKAGDQIRDFIEDLSVKPDLLESLPQGSIDFQAMIQDIISGKLDPKTLIPYALAFLKSKDKGKNTGNSGGWD